MRRELLKKKQIIRNSVDCGGTDHRRERRV